MPTAPTAPKVLNKRNKPSMDNAVYVGRPSTWGNPFIIGLHGTREECVDKFRQWLCDSPSIQQHLGELRGKNLVCWCAPKACHADVLLEMANK